MPFPSQFSQLPSLLEVMNPSPLTISPDLSVAAAIALMSQAQGSYCTLLNADADAPVELEFRHQNSCVLATEGRQLCGILTERDVVRLTADRRDLAATRVGDVMTRQIVTLTDSPAVTAMTALSLFSQHRIRHLPIVDESGQLLGMITPDLLRQILQPVNLLKMRSIEDIMTAPVIHASATASVLSIAQQMATHRVSCIVMTATTPDDSAADPVILKPLGLITERDIVQFQTLGIDLAATQAQEVMSSPVFCLHPQESLWRAQQEMQARRIRRLAIADSSGQLLGIVTQTSLLQPLDPMEVLGMVDILHHQVQVQTAAVEQTNQELVRARDLLEHQVAERTAQLSEINQQLQQEILQHRQSEVALQETLSALEFEKQALRQSERKFRKQAMLLSIATDAILVRDLENYIRFWNNGAERIYGWTTAEAIDRSATTLLYQDPLPEVAVAFETVLQQGKWQGELHKVTKTGQPVIVQSRWTLVRDEAGSPKEILSVDTDITEKKQLEQQFLRAQRLESLGTLASGIAHDMNNVLTPILAASQLLPLRLTNIDDRSQSLLRILEESAKRGTNLVQQILSFARGSDDTRSLVQIRHILSEVARVARQTFPKSIDISLNLATCDLWQIAADATQLHQVLMNLTINARDAMPNGGTLTIAAENLIIDENYAAMNIDARVGPYVVVTVADTGSGIPPEILARIFEPFFTTKDPEKGTGLGLSTTLGIVKSHGGFVCATSEVGQGSQFKIYLPAEESSETVSAITSGRLANDTLELPPGNQELVLVVDDEVSVREIIKASLETYNYRTISASDGIEAIALYAQYQSAIQVILLDLMMPSLDSPSTIRALQRINPHVSIVVMSGLAANEPIENMSDVTVQAFLAKPFTSQELLQTLHRLRLAVVPVGD